MTSQLTPSQKRNLRRATNRVTKNIKTELDTIKKDDGKLYLRTTTSGGVFSPYSEENKNGDKTMSVCKPGETPTVYMTGDVTITEDSYYIRILRLPKEIRKIGEYLILTKRVDELQKLLDDNKHLPHAEDTKKAVNSILGQTIKVTIDNA